MADPDSLTVACPDCFAPPGQECRTSNPRTASTHADRHRAAQLRAVDHGTCALCGNPMVRGTPTVTTTGAPIEAWHPNPEHADTCPPMPDPAEDWNAYAAAVQAGLAPGRPGLQHFIPAGAVMAPPLPVCPECATGKHQNCLGQALDHTTDTIAACNCDHTDLEPTP